ncbi:MAG: Gfo/Idh/MocA family oxidoreductase [Provencibacterium sp.]|jgi:predicted dehydrogenase|nr:Gfo/Idh/MocA family oxidoreductase [Provencibacterium sp.]
MEKVRFGIIGLGKIASRFARVLGQSESGELFAAAARDADRAAHFAGEYGAKRSYGSYSELIQDPEVELVYIAVPHNFHYDLIKECLLNGKGVLCEKPMVLTRDKAKVLCSLAKKKNLFLMEAMWTRCLPAVRRAAEWAQSGKIGDIKLIDAAFCFRSEFDPASRLFNPALAGGALYDVGVYPLMFAMDIAGEIPAETAGFASMCPTGVDDCNALLLRFSGGALALIRSASSVLMPPDAVIYGTKGHIRLPNFYRAESAELYESGGRLLECYEAPFVDGFLYEIEHAAQLFREGKIESERVPWQDTIACAGIFDEMREKWGIAGER